MIVLDTNVVAAMMRREVDTKIRVGLIVFRLNPFG
jgi:predicted nucleic acid-binding protein